MINQLAFEDDTYPAVIRRTSDGKSLIPLAIVVFTAGVSIILKPWMGSDQIEKAIVNRHNVEAYQVDDHKGSNKFLLQKRIKSLSDKESAEEL